MLASYAFWPFAHIQSNSRANFQKAADFRTKYENLVTKGDFIDLKTDNENVFAFERNYKNESIIIIGNLDFKNPQYKITIRVPNVKKKNDFEFIAGNENVKAGNRKIFTDLDNGEIKVIRVIRQRKEL